MISLLVFVLCALTSLACAVLLLRAYRRSQVRLLFWSALCFFAFTLNNILLIVDLRFIPTIDLSILRTATTFVGVCCLLYGLIWEDTPALPAERK